MRIYNYAWYLPQPSCPLPMMLRQKGEGKKQPPLAAVVEKPCLDASSNPLVLW